MTKTTVLRLLGLTLLAGVVAISYGSSCMFLGNDDVTSGSSDVLTQAILPAPSNGLTNVPITQELSWKTLCPITSYDIYFGTLNPPALVTTTTNNSYQLVGLLYSTTYYWRIDSRNATSVITGTVWSFTTLVSPPPAPAQAATPSPADAAANVSVSQQLGWSTASDATSYDVYFSTNPTQPGFIGNTAITGYNPGPLNYNTTYYWRVNSKNSTGATTGNIWSFTTRPLSSVLAQAGSPNPVNGAVGVALNQQLGWGAAVGATYYEVYFGTTPGQPVYKTSTGNMVYNTALNYGTTYYWRIDSANAAGKIAGNVWSFTTVSAPVPAQAGSPNPNDGAGDIPVNQQLGWAAAANTTSYDVYFGTNSGQLTYKTSTVATVYNPGMLSNNTTYYWRIDTRNAYGTTAGNIWNFLTESLPPLPGQADMPVPPNTAIGVPVDQQINWQAAPDATSYDVYFGTTYPPLWKANTSSTNYNPGTLQRNITYYWRIDSKNSRGTTVGQAWSFTTTPWEMKIADGTAGSPSSRYDHSMVWNGSRAILFGGYAGTLTNDLWWYNPGNNTWTEKIANGDPNSPPSRYAHSMVWDGTRVILFGGYNWSLGYLNDLWWYNPSTNTWTQKIANGDPDSPPSKYAPKMVWDGSRVIMFGGYDNWNGYSNDLWWYNPSTNTWTQKIANGDPNSPLGRYSHSMVWDGSRMILFGGDIGFDYTNDLWWYNPSTNTWVQKIAYGDPGAPNGRYTHAAAWDGSRMIMFGGEDWWDYTNDLWWYIPSSNTWVQKVYYDAPGSPTGRYGPAMVWDGARAIMFGGEDWNNMVNDLWWYRP